MLSRLFNCKKTRVVFVLNIEAESSQRHTQFKKRDSDIFTTPQECTYAYQCAKNIYNQAIDAVPYNDKTIKFNIFLYGKLNGVKIDMTFTDLSSFRKFLEEKALIKPAEKHSDTMHASP